MAKAFDLIVIGTGTAAATAANRCANAGWRVAMIDHLPYGGTARCAVVTPRRYWSALPKRSTLRAGRGARGLLAATHRSTGAP